MEYEIPTYMFLVTKSEMALLHNLRGMVPEEETEEDKVKLRPPLQLMAYAGDRHLGDFLIDGMNLVSDCANIGAQLRDTILNVPPETDDHDDLGVEGDACAASPVHSLNENFDDEPVQWEEFRTQVVPSYVQNVTFTVSKNDLDQERRNELEEKFPDVLVQESGSNISVERHGCAKQPLEKPSGVKSAMFELEKDYPSILETSLRKQYPWARIKRSYVPNGKRAHQDIENHLQDFAEYMTESPQDAEFDVPMDQDLSWDTLPLRRRASVAHARAIQHGRWGQTLADPCTNCKKEGYKCRVYRPAFISNNDSTIQLDLGKGCQHCRLKDVECDITALRANSESAPAISTINPVESPTSGRGHSADPFSEAICETPSSSRKLSLAARISWSTVPATHNFVTTRLNYQSDMFELCHRLGFHHASPIHLWHMYQIWMQQQIMRPYQPGLMPIQGYYTSLVYIYIIACARQDYALGFAALLQFQITNFQQPNVLPSIGKCIMRAFENLPIESPLCRWIPTLFFHEWDPVNKLDYDGLVQDIAISDKESLSKFLYGVASAGGSHARGGRNKLLERWCSVHIHEPNSKQDRDCMTAERECKYKLQETSRGSPNKVMGKRSFGGLTSGNNTKKFKPNHKINSSRSASKGPARERPAAELAEYGEIEATLSENLDAVDLEDEFVHNPGERRRSKRQAEKRTLRLGKYVVPDSDDDNDESGNDDHNKYEDGGDGFSTTKDSGSTRSTVLSVDNLISLGSIEESDTNSSNIPGGQNGRSTSSVPVRGRRTPRVTTPRSETHTSERRSARVSAQALPSGYYRQRLSSKEFGNTMWNSYKR